MIRKASILTAAIAGSLAVASAWAQDFQRVAPNQPKPEKPGTISTPEQKPIVPPAANKQLLAALKGLKFVPSVKQIVRTGASSQGVDVDQGLALLNDPAIRAKLQDFIGKPLFTGDLPRISQLILDWYRAHDLPVVDVAYPEQDISTGTVQAVVTVYRLGKVKFEGNQWFSDQLLRSEMNIAPGNPIDFGTLRNDLNRLNNNSFRQVNAVLARGDEVGFTDIDVTVQDRFPLRVYAGYDNNGVPVTGRDEYSAGFNYGNLFGLDHQISYRFITTPDLWQTRSRGAGHSNDPRFMAHSLTYSAPLPWGDTLNVFGSYVQQVPNVGANFDQVGHSLQLSLRYLKPLPTIGTITQSVQGGFDYKRSDNNLAFGGTQIFAATTNVEQFLLIYDATRTDSWGQTALENQLVYSPGGLSDGNKTPVFIASGVTGAKANYLYDNLQITRVDFLPWQFSTMIRLDGQLATGELLPSEQIGAGGVDSVRGYNPRTANGTRGLLGSVELHSPTYNPLQRLGLPVDDTGQLLAFYDAGFVSDLNAQTGQPKSASLQSLGFGARYSAGRYLDVRFDYGWQLSRAPGATHLGNLANVSVTLAY